MTMPPSCIGLGRPSALGFGDPWVSHPARIVDIRPEVLGVRSYDLEFLDGARRDTYAFAPGQFNMLLLPGIGEAAISIASAPSLPRRLTHTVRGVGNVTLAMERLGVGGEILLRGPYGRPWPLDEIAGMDVVVVAGGLGLASLRAALLEIARRRGAFGRVVVLHGAKTPADLLYRGEQASLSEAGIETIPIVDAPDDAWRGAVGLVTDLLGSLSFASAPALLCCGPDPMMAAVARAAAMRGIEPERIWVSLERNMSCAVGQCGLCQLGPFFVCLDGPVFRFDAVARYLGVRCL